MARPDAFCQELADELHAPSGVRLSRPNIGRWLATLGLMCKKSVRASEQDHPDLKADRATWHGRLIDACGGDLSRAMFFDETGRDQPDAHARPMRRSLAVRRPRAGGALAQMITAVAAIRPCGLTAAATTPHAMDGELFRRLRRARARAGVVARRRRGQGQVPAHKLPGVRAAIEAAGATLLWLPPYSPDLKCD